MRIVDTVLADLVAKLQLGTRVSAKLLFRSPRNVEHLLRVPRLAKQSFTDRGVTKLELGNEGTKRENSPC